MTQPDEPRGWDGWLGPRHWAPIGSILGIAVVALAVLLALGVTGDETVVKECKPGEPGCELRQKIHQHADLALFIRGKQFDFGQPQFVSTAEKELSPNVHIHDPRHTVVHVHREQTTWDEFFLSLGFELGDTCLKLPSGEKLCTNERETLKFYVNGVKVDSLMFENIASLSRLLISYGSESEAEIQAQVAQITDQACIPAGLCQARGSGAGEHGEPCAAGSDTCVK